MSDSFSLIELEKHRDERGIFARTFDTQSVPFEILQSNISFNPGIHTLRGMHFQTGGPEENKLVTLISGSVFMVLVDLRPKSQKYLIPETLELDEPLGKSVLIPSGFATGWLSTTINTTLQYHMSARFEECTYSGIRYNDPKLEIKWPFKPKVISEQDLNWPSIT